jgi:hypothetical protein
MKSHFRREVIGMYLYALAVPIVGLVATIVVQTVRGALSHHALHAVTSSPVHAGP